MKQVITGWTYPEDTYKPFTWRQADWTQEDCRALHGCLPMIFQKRGKNSDWPGNEEPVKVRVTVEFFD